MKQCKEKRHTQKYTNQALTHQSIRHVGWARLIKRLVYNPRSRKYGVYSKIRRKRIGSRYLLWSMSLSLSTWHKYKIFQWYPLLWNLYKSKNEISKFLYVGISYCFQWKFNTGHPMYKISIFQILDNVMFTMARNVCQFRTKEIHAVIFNPFDTLTHGCRVRCTFADLSVFCYKWSRTKYCHLYL